MLFMVSPEALDPEKDKAHDVKVDTLIGSEKVTTYSAEPV